MDVASILDRVCRRVRIAGAGVSGRDVARGTANGPVNGSGGWIDLALKVAIAASFFAVVQVLSNLFAGQEPTVSLAFAGISGGLATILGLVFGRPAGPGLGLGQVVGGGLTVGLSLDILSGALATVVAAAVAVETLMATRRGRPDPLVPDVSAVLVFIGVFAVVETALLAVASLSGFVTFDAVGLLERFVATVVGAGVLILALNLVTSGVLRLAHWRRRR